MKRQREEVIQIEDEEDLEVIPATQLAPAIQPPPTDLEIPDTVITPASQEKQPIPSTAPPDLPSKRRRVPTKRSRQALDEGLIK